MDLPDAMDVVFNVIWHIKIDDTFHLENVFGISYTRIFASHKRSGCNHGNIFKVGTVYENWSLV